ncbi:porin (plasmid) [Burkholderia sp. SFA1]|uniref:porin n=1 Tax=unclassified Caballeronia TaxID=2646786 RepID=UPI0002388113|nr:MULTISPECIES: porin [unclassified Caballeronia]AET94848.1 porin [Burkholderia sp. YI23]MCE4546005.1 porin [Caballeronia sp. PC1]MCE4571873.1 porin [Caballeronia sp. CLC5]BBQ02515.1 porin [Burkholderia sp. SFA1]
MKKTLIVGAALATLAGAAQAQSNVTLYGLIDAGITYTNSQVTGGAGGHSNWQMTSGGVQYSRWGLRGAEDLGGGLQAIFTLENGFNVNNGQLSSANRIFNRLAYVGVSSRDFGALTLGRQTDGMVDFVGPLSLTGTQYGGTHFAHPFDVDNLNDSFQINNSVKYQSPDFAGFKLGALYGFSNQAGGFANNRAYSVGASYNWGPLKFGAGYLHLNNSAATLAQLNTGGAVTDTLGTSLSGALTPTAVPLGALARRQQTWGGGVNYAFGPLVAGIVYTQTNLTELFLTGFNTHFQNYEGNIRFALTPAVMLAAAYTYSRAGGNAGGGAPHWNQVSSLANYAFSKRTDVYIQSTYQSVSARAGNPLGVAWINGVSSPASTSNQIEATVGVRHRF